ncbi:MAG TPA: hypothetical protein VHX44_16390, partial [Planctomycetota bacterium]|nr:hypothetical protein [Planctomycetota bacterium]
MAHSIAHQRFGKLPGSTHPPAMFMRGSPLWVRDPSPATQLLTGQWTHRDVVGMSRRCWHRCVAQIGCLEDAAVSNRALCRQYMQLVTG